MTKPTIAEYRDMASEVWQIFKKCYPDDVPADVFVNESQALGNKYYHDVRRWEFVVKMLRVFMQELNEIKGVDHGAVKKDNNGNVRDM